MKAQTNDGISLARRFAHGIFWSLSSSVASRIFTLLGVAIVARCLGQVGFGKLAMIQSTIGFLGTFAVLGVGMTATKYVSELRQSDPLRAGRIIGLVYLVSWITGSCMALGCLLVSPWLASRFLNAPQLAPELRLASLLLLVSAGFGPQNGILAGCQAFRALARVTFWQGLFSLPCTAALVWWFGLRGVIVALILTSLFAAILSAFYLAREYRAYGIMIQFLQSWRERAILWRFSLPAFIASLLYTVVLWAANAILANQSKGYAELGLFNAAMQLQWMVTGFTTILAMVSVPMLAEILGLQEGERFARAFNLNLKLTWGLACIAGFGLLGTAPWLIKLFGEKFQESISILGLVIAFTVVSTASATCGQAFYASGRMWWGLSTTLFWSALALGAAWMLIPNYGAQGLAASFTISYVLTLILQLMLLKTLFGKAMVSKVSLPFFGTIILIGCVLLGKRFIPGKEIVFLSIAGLLFLLYLRTNNEIISRVLKQYKPV